MKKWLVCLCLLMLITLAAACDSQSPATQPSATAPNWTEVVGSVNGADVYRYEYDYYFNTYFNEYFGNYYDSLILYEDVDLLDEESSRDFLGNLENFAWNSSIQASLIRQMAAAEYDLSLEPIYYEEILLPDTALSLNTNRLWALIYPFLEEETRAAKGVSDEEAEDYYNGDPSAWDCRKVAHIIVTAQQLMEEAAENEEGMDYDEAEAAARARAEDIIAKLAAGEDFADLAARYGADGTAQTGGEMDLYFNVYGGGINDPESGFDQDFAAGAFSLNNVGDTSKEPVESAFGFHIIKLLDKREGFAQVKEFVLDTLQFVDSYEVNEYFSQKMQDMEDAADVQRNFEFRYYVEPEDELE
ncbi:MAG: peptidylprolyl isomerase [Clostridiales bacterium]|nr:peptidylprolyl isomerase [Clostridiales bacterium]